jgi:hypothetical protein
VEAVVKRFPNRIKSECGVEEKSWTQKNENRLP